MRGWDCFRDYKKNSQRKEEKWNKCETVTRSKHSHMLNSNKKPYPARNCPSIVMFTPQVINLLIILACSPSSFFLLPFSPSSFFPFLSFLLTSLFLLFLLLLSVLFLSELPRPECHGWSKVIFAMDCCFAMWIDAKSWNSTTWTTWTTWTTFNLC